VTAGDKMHIFTQQKSNATPLSLFLLEYKFHVLISKCLLKTELNIYWSAGRAFWCTHLQRKQAGDELICGLKLNTHGCRRQSLFIFGCRHQG
jgi:hypothetical protein